MKSNPKTEQKPEIDLVVALERAIQIAAEAHAGQRDKSGDPYILHPLRVMLRVESAMDKIAAVLHDVVEDCPNWTLDRLRDAGIPPQAIAVVDLLTQRPGMDYESYLARIEANPAAVQVKLADLRDNMDVRRMAVVAERDRERLNKYLRAERRFLGLEPENSNQVDGFNPVPKDKEKI